MLAQEKGCAGFGFEFGEVKGTEKTVVSVCERSRVRGSVGIMRDDSWRPLCVQSQARCLFRVHMQLH